MAGEREFQIFVKPGGAVCNLACRYCYYLEKQGLYPDARGLRMADDLLETYIVQHIELAHGNVIRFSWHGGEPTILGVDYFRRIVELQRKHAPHTTGRQTIKKRGRQNQGCGNGFFWRTPGDVIVA